MFLVVCQWCEDETTKRGMRRARLAQKPFFISTGLYIAIFM
ncbi:hypothetical protein HMPREF3034_01085 [Prevotella sp. DNF00663]|nr:hypothetical protein HMPREF3034_01085 [Prevotella sp. DNF00663]